MMFGNYQLPPSRTFQKHEFIDSLAKREQFAVTLRKSKKRDLLNIKRIKLAETLSKRKERLGLCSPISTASSTKHRECIDCGISNLVLDS